MRSGLIQYKVNGSDLGSNQCVCSAQDDMIDDPTRKLCCLETENFVTDERIFQALKIVSSIQKSKQIWICYKCIVHFLARRRVRSVYPTRCQEADFLSEVH